MADTSLADGLSNLAKVIEELRDAVKKGNEQEEDHAEEAESRWWTTFGHDFKEKYSKYFTSMHAGMTKLSGLGDKLLTSIDDKVTGTRDSIVSGLMGAATFAAAVFGLSAALEGFTKATDWFGVNADWSEKIGSALANVVAKFVGLDENEAMSLATSISGFMDSLGSIASSVGNAAVTLALWWNGEHTAKDLWSSLSSLGTALWDAKEELALAALILAPGSTIRLAISGISLAFTGLGAALSMMLGGLTAIGGVLGFTGGAAAAVGTATIIGVVALVANTFNALYQGIKVFSDTWNETGSFVSALNAFAGEFLANFLGWPVKLAADAANWVANLFGFDDIFSEDFDPVGAIRGAYMSMMKWFYDSETGKILGIDWGAAIATLSEWASLAYDNAVATIEKTIDNMITSITDWVTGLIDSVTNFISDKMAAAFDWLDFNADPDNPNSPGVTASTAGRYANHPGAQPDPVVVPLPRQSEVDRLNERKNAFEEATRMFERKEREMLARSMIVQQNSSVTNNTVTPGAVKTHTPDN